MKVEDMVKMESISKPPSRASKTAKKPKRYFSIFGSNEIILIDVWRDFGNLHLNSFSNFAFSSLIFSYQLEQSARDGRALSQARQRGKT